MIRLLLLHSFLLISFATMADSTLVKTLNELHAAAKKAKPGDEIILQNGEWNNVVIKLTANGTKEKPIRISAQTAGKVFITGESQLRLGGSYLIVDGLYFMNGYAGKDPVISFRTDKDNVANHCRVTNTVINDFNNPKRMSENNWILFYGKNNRLDHCSFSDKKNMGVLLAVVLDDDRSRENFHSIDHNYFGRRPSLASNGGEIIRVGVSQHCEFNSNTQITDNFFEECDGETEIVSIKSGSNVVRGNVFKESQGGVVLRHGNYNTVENNIFLGNGKEGTGGVRVINKGQWVVNNFFYQCRGVDFRAPLSIMNGIPNSPAHRYVQVTDAVIANNTFVDCAPISFCEGSDVERSLPPSNVLLINNLFSNQKDTILYHVYDDITGFTFKGNEISARMKQPVTNGFRRTSFTTQKNDRIAFPVSNSKAVVKLSDSLQQAATERLQHKLSSSTGFSNLLLLKRIQANAQTTTGAAWFKQFTREKNIPPLTVNCNTAEEVYKQLERNEPVIIHLTSSEYNLTKPFLITKKVQFTGTQTELKFNTGQQLAVFLIAGNGNLHLNKLSVNGEGVTAKHLISSDSIGSSNHYNLFVTNCSIRNLNQQNGCETIFYAYKSMIADSIVIRNNSFTSNTANTFSMAEETDDKGYYNAEKIIIGHNQFNKQTGVLLNVYRGGNDESTMGPQLFFSHNKLTDCNTPDASPLISLTGVQVTNIFSNQFTGSNPAKTLVLYKDTVRARHSFEKNILTQSGSIEKNKFVIANQNAVR